MKRTPTHIGAAMPQTGRPAAEMNKLCPDRTGRRGFHARRSGLGAYLFLSPTLLIFSVFVLFPALFSFYLRFYRWNMFRPDRSTVGFGNYSRLLESPEFWMVLKNTVVYTIGTVPLNMTFALLIAYFLNKRIVGKKFLRAAFFAPVVISPVAAAVIWRWIYEPNFGVLNYALSWFGIPPVNWLNNPSAAMTALIIMGVWKSFG